MEKQIDNFISFSNISKFLAGYPSAIKKGYKKGKYLKAVEMLRMILSTWMKYQDDYTKDTFKMQRFIVFYTENNKNKSCEVYALSEYGAMCAFLIHSRNCIIKHVQPLGKYLEGYYKPDFTQIGKF